MSLQERVEKKLHRMRADRNWLFVKSLFRPTVIIVSHKRSGFQWFRQICYANLRKHAVMPPGARYQHFNIERVPAKNRLDRNALLVGGRAAGARNDRIRAGPAGRVALAAPIGARLRDRGVA